MDTGVSMIEVSGEIDARLMMELCALIGSLIDEDQAQVVLEFSRVEHVHYQGIGLLTERARQLRSLGGELRIIGVSPYVRDIFRAVDAERFIHLLRRDGNSAQGRPRAEESALPPGP